jgi:hypothetical protein
MTEQPAEPITEQEWLQNAVPLRTTAPQHYVPNAHRLPVADVVQKRSGLAAKFLGTIDSAFDKADGELVGRRATDAGLLRLAADVDAPGPVQSRRTPLDQHAEISASKAAEALSLGELDEGIAWLQSALAFAQNHRHAVTHGGVDQ